jgi:hypothetical protein
MSFIPEHRYPWTYVSLSVLRGLSIMALIFGIFFWIIGIFAARSPIPIIESQSYSERQSFQSRVTEERQADIILALKICMVSTAFMIILTIAIAQLDLSSHVQLRWPLNEAIDQKAPSSPPQAPGHLLPQHQRPVARRARSEHKQVAPNEIDPSSVTLLDLDALDQQLAERIRKS